MPVINVNNGGNLLQCIPINVKIENKAMKQHIEKAVYKRYDAENNDEEDEEDSDETETDIIDDDITISSDEEAELEAQRIRFHELLSSRVKNKDNSSATIATAGGSGTRSRSRLRSDGSTSGASKSSSPIKNGKKNSQKSPSKRVRTASICSVASSLANSDSETSACGQIFVYTQKQQMIFKCCFCEFYFDNMSFYAQHMEYLHKLFEANKSVSPSRKSARKQAIKSEKQENINLPNTAILDCCGSIFVLNYQKLFLTCGHCDCRYANLELFHKHLSQQHQLFQGPVQEIDVLPKKEIKAEVFIITELNAEHRSRSATPPDHMVTIPKAVAKKKGSQATIETAEPPVDTPREHNANTASKAVVMQRIDERETMASEQITSEEESSPDSKNSKVKKKRKKRKAAYSRSAKRKIVPKPVAAVKITKEEPRVDDVAAITNTIAAVAKDVSMDTTESTESAVVAALPINNMEIPVVSLNNSEANVKQTHSTDHKETAAVVNIDQNPLRENKIEESAAKENKHTSTVELILTENKDSLNVAISTEEKNQLSAKISLESAEKQTLKIASPLKRKRGNRSTPAKARGTKKSLSPAQNQMDQQMTYNISNEKETKAALKIGVSGKSVKKAKTPIKQQKLSEIFKKTIPNQLSKPQNESILMAGDVLMDLPEKSIENTQNDMFKNQENETIIQQSVENEQTENNSVISPKNPQNDVNNDNIVKTQLSAEPEETLSVVNADLAEEPLRKTKKRQSKKQENNEICEKHLAEEKIETAAEATNVVEKPFRKTNKRLSKKQQSELINDNQLLEEKSETVAEQPIRKPNKRISKKAQKQLNTNVLTEEQAELSEMPMRKTQKRVPKKQQCEPIKPSEEVEAVDDSTALAELLNLSKELIGSTKKRISRKPQNDTINPRSIKKQISEEQVDVIQNHVADIAESSINALENQIEQTLQTKTKKRVIKKSQSESINEPTTDVPPVLISVNTTEGTRLLNEILLQTTTADISMIPEPLKSPKIEDEPQPSDVVPLFMPEPQTIDNKLRYACDVCPKAFSKVSRLIEHKRLHTGEKPFACEICGKTFRMKIRMVEHRLRHNKEKAFKCEICEMCTATKQDLVLHKRHHSNDRRYQCSVCPKAFVRNSDLKIHLRVHTGEKPFACEICGRTFRANQNLIVHRRSHMGEKNFICEFCKKGFMRNVDLKVHLRSHTGEKPYKCEICDRGYSSRTHVRAHIEREHVAPKNRKARKKPGPKQRSEMKAELVRQRQIIAELEQKLKEQMGPDEKIIKENETESLATHSNRSSPYQHNTHAGSSPMCHTTQHSSPTALTIMQKIEQTPPKRGAVQQVSVTVSMQVENVAAVAAMVDDDEKNSSIEKENETAGNSKATQLVKKEKKITNYFTVVGQKTEV